MSCTLYWMPVSNQNNYVDGGQLRDILQNKFGFPSKIDHSHIDYLEGLKDAGHEGAQTLIDAIYQFDVIEINQEC